MLSSVDIALWLLGALAQAVALVAAFRARAYRTHVTLFLFLLASWVVAAGRFFAYSTYGYASIEYRYAYYYSDSLLTIFLYFALIELYTKVFEEMGVSRYLRVGAVLLLCATTLFSYQAVHGATDKLITRLVVELSLNIYFVGLVLTYVLWGAVVKMRETRTRLIQLVLGLGVYFSAFAANYALRNLYPQSSFVWMYLPPLMGIWLPLAWAYTFLRIPEDARLATARVVSAQSRVAAEPR